MDTTLVYLFDPLCGWCYGGTRAISALVETHDVSVELLPTGLFSGSGARSMDSGFAAYAWSNDQRIARLTGQSFTGTYRDLVLKNREQRFDSGPATLALTAVSMTNPIQELEALKAIQRARYVEGQDVTAWETLTTILKEHGLDEAAAMLLGDQSILLSENQRRTDLALSLMRELGSSGVPTFVAKSGSKQRLLNAASVFANPEALISQLKIA